MARGARRWSALLVLALLASVPIPPGARAAQTSTGGLDPSFGREGVYRLDMTQPSLDVAHDSVMGRAGLIAAGSAGDRFALAAFNSDPYRFANGHQQRIVDFGRPSAAHAVAEQNSRLVAAGRAGDDFALVHLQPNGDPAAGFPDEGRVRTSFGAPAVAYGLAPMAELAHLAVGTVQSGTGSSVAMARYDRAGRLDPSFGSGGRVVLDVTAGLDSANAVYVLPWGGGSEPILVAGQAGAGALVARLRGDGTPDPAFGAGGHVVLDLSPGDDVARSVVPFGSGILVAGSAGSQAFLAALGPTGALDPAFGVGGVVRTTFGGTGARLSAVSLIMDRIVVGGTVTGPGGDDAVIARFGFDGAPDPGFGTSGRTVVDLGGRSDQGNALTWYGGVSDIRMVGGDGADMVSVSIDSGDGSPGYGPGDYGRRVVDFGAETLEGASGVAVLPDGRIVVAGHGTRGMILVRLLADGDPDPSFGRGGVTVIPVAAHVAGVAVVDGLIHVLARRAGDLHGTGVFRYSADGVLDASYGIDGFAPTQLTAASGLAATPDGGLLVGGSSQVVRLTPSGDIAATYGATNWPFHLVGLTVQPDGKFVVLSENSQEVGAHLQRFHADGTVDESFFSAGWLTGTPVIADPGTLLLLADGRLAVSGRTTTINGAPPPVRELVLAGFRTDGWLDNTFGTLGATRTDVGGVERVVAVHQQADGRIVSVFHRGQDAPADPVGLARYLPDGTLDPSFGAEGVATVAAVYPVASALTGTGRILVAGSAGADLAVARALPADADAPASYHPLEPVRLLDTRTGVGAPTGQLGARSTLRLPVAGRGGVPASGAAAVLLNVTVTEPTEVSFLTAWPAGRPRPVASNLNVAPGRTAANLVVAKLGRFGSVDLYNNAGSAHVIADLAGWYGGTDGDSYSTLSPARLLDTRTGTGAPAGRVGPGGTLSLQVTGRGGVPAGGVSAVVLNVTATEPTATSYLTAWPAGQARPLASNLNYTADQTVPNLVTVKVGAGGRVDLYNNIGSVHVVADVAGWYGAEGQATGGALFSTRVPSRILDTRLGQGAPAARVGPASTLSVQVTGRGGVPGTGVAAVVLNVTVTEPTAVSYLTAWPAGETRPLASNLNYAAGQTVPNLVTVKVGAGGRIHLYNDLGWAHVIADVAGWYGPA